MKPRIFTLDETTQIAKMLNAEAKHSHIFLFHGEMGSGKTTLIKSMCRQLGVNEHTSSPTFAIVNTYQGTQHIIYHFDLFRLRDVHELEAIGFSEYVDSGNMLFIEWPEQALPLLKGYEVVKIVLETIDTEHRRISMQIETL
ncbi:MAG TPA: tRNA (adenosine(37)-N6)-threonylcarbamoyltransferase complex ATPase subunit type 1 TsaE [Chitinophagales bacterium]|nr:tRNA (adenosine(37)-N6)-threonylcarbamoyltransferase complex ATPase subunit type 1 TsaE [Chitinophagales bacterium]HMX05011.1 tRNA (adenosine(37)-N6)-threonylcarbamoyltransferase complex ATPase subunit type 1 TsaE [Chitinophagales bacterium]HMZ89867.1 tRNA (adenosine(37)-N6)-threonylcarbamoyltransferase complex ATPase subunit type 1 TsaE [Chitinophagales bacterium]HNA58115.1 tRNA (adenosine(37)-N6)-threonylcarbamoyltransferase complex ATPase subunit type 1 TsaE [Chitinophagales bacterium]HNE